MAALLILIGVVAGIPYLLVQFAPNLMPDGFRPADVAAALLRPDDGTVALAAITVVGWLAWVIITVSVIVEVIAFVRVVPSPTLPGLSLPQAGARQLVAAAALLFMVAPLTSGAADTAPPTATSTTAPAPTASHDVALRPPASTQPVRTATIADEPPAPAAAGRGQRDRIHVVRSGENLWTLAQRYLGHASRYGEIAAVNADILHGHPDRLLPGMKLRIPDAHDGRHGAGPRTVTVERGDTLSEIAADELGDPNRYPEIAKASRRITQPDGRHLTDPDLIDIGWKLRIPAERNRHGHPPATPNRHQVDPKTKPVKPTTPAPTTPTDTASAPAEQHTEQPADGSADNLGSVTPGWLLTGLTGGGTILAAGLLVALRRRRRAQFRSRQPGRFMPAPDPGLVPVEKTIVAVGDAAIPTVELVDDLLRRLGAARAAANLAMPDLLAVEISHAGLTLHLDEDCDLTPPWNGPAAHTTWTVSAAVHPDQIGPSVPDHPAPWPLLATIGTDDDGSVWLLNLEQVPAISLSGDPEYTRDLARHLAAEMACNPWSQQVHVDCIGVGQEVVAMSPDRIHAHHTTALAGVLTEATTDADTVLSRATDAQVSTATGRAHLVGADVWPARMLLLDATASDSSSLGVNELVRLVRVNSGRTGIAVVVHSDEAPPATDLAIEVSSDGRLKAPRLGLELTAVGLTADEAAGCAALLAQADDETATEMPRRAGADGWRRYSDEAGALGSEFTKPRRAAATDPSTGSEPGHGSSAVDAEHPARQVAPEPGSLLPEADGAYERVAATTAQDLAVLTPRVPSETRIAVEGADQLLDADLTAWFSDTCALPRLTLLGPVEVRAHGTAIAKRKAFYTEVVAYLATRPHGATPEEVADAFSITPARARNDVKVVRDWLGINSLTGRLHLPDARDSAAAHARGVAVYQIEGLLVDADLLRRLRVRGQARGAEGIADLQTALTLVTGQPLDKLRPGGWTWMYDGDRLDQHLTCAIVDIAHIVTTHHLHAGNLADARTSTGTALLAAPHEEISRLDLAAVSDAEGQHREAHRIIKNEVCNRSDDGQPPIDLSIRTQQILVDHEQWVHDREAS